jgi:hypothetical protein
MILKLIQRIVLICIMLGTVNTIYCQTDWESYYSETTLPKKAKLKTVKYKSYDYAINGYIFEKQFVNGQELNFYNTNTKTDVIPIYIIPVPVSKTKLTNPIISGTFFMKDGISFLESTIKQKHNWPSGEIYINGIFKLSNTFDDKGLTIKPSEAKELSIKTEYIIKCSGFYDENKYPITLAKNSNNNDYDYKIEFDDRTLEASLTADYLKKIFFPTVDNLFRETKSSVIQYRVSLKFDDYIKNSKNVKLIYKNGDVFVGKVETYDKKYIANEGEYVFFNGETFIGKLDRYSIIWTDGEWKFNDGSTENGDWLKKYNVTSDALSSAKTMTEKHNLAIQLYEEQQQKLQAEKIAKQKAEEKKKIAEQKKKQALIAKYGTHYGTLISEGELDVGMSQLMVNEVWNKEFFVISKSVRSGESIEIWEFSKDKMQMAIINEGAKHKDSGGGEAAIAAIFLMELSDALGGPSAPQMIIFTNNKLTDIYR